MGSASQDNDERQSSAISSHTAAAKTSSEVEAKLGKAGDGPPLHPSRGSEGVLAALSTMINDNLGLFRAGTATMVVGSALTISFLVYRRGLHGFVSAAQVPASYFERRKRVRVRVAKIIESAAVLPKLDGVYGGENPAVALRGGDTGRLRRGSDVLLHTEHITLPRRLLRLSPRSLLPSAVGAEAATFTLRLCGVLAEEEGVALAREELVKPLVGRYCDAELLYREQRPGASPSSGSGAIFGIGASAQTPWPVAVCHIHRRRGELWRDVLQPRLDPAAGFGEHLVSEGLARAREEKWWAPDSINTPSASGSASVTAAAAAEIRASSAQSYHHPGGEAGGAPRGGGDGSEQPFPALKRLLEDRERFVAAEENAEIAKRGLWGLQQQQQHGEADHDNATVAMGTVSNAAKGLGKRSVGAVRALVAFFLRRSS